MITIFLMDSDMYKGEPNYFYDFKLSLTRSRDGKYFDVKVKTNEFGGGEIYITPVGGSLSLEKDEDLRIPINLRGRGKSKAKKRVESLAQSMINNMLDKSIAERYKKKSRIKKG